MKGVRNCEECLLVFKPVGFLTAEERIKKHEETIHTIECQECSRKFISRAHLWFHVESFHNTRCGDCISFCENQCTINYAKMMELRNEKLLEAGLVEKAEAAEAARVNQPLWSSQGLISMTPQARKQCKYNRNLTVFKTRVQKRPSRAPLPIGRFWCPRAGKTSRFCLHKSFGNFRNQNFSFQRGRPRRPRIGVCEFP